MLTTVFICAALFVIYGFLRPRAGCGGNCGMCPNACRTAERDDHA